MKHLHSTMEFWRRKKGKEMEKEKEETRKYFLLENGSIFLQKLIADCNGMSNPIRMFSSDQINKATNHFDPEYCLPELSEYSYDCFTYYKGVIEGRSYMIKRFTRQEYAYKEIVLSTRVSNHIGFLKLIGCCLEFPLPVLVVEDLDYTSLNFRGKVGSSVLPWNVRLKIAKEVATAITYLHTAFPRIIIHRNILPINVFLDKNETAKLTDFSDAVTLPEGKTWIEEKTLRGNVGYTDPNYITTLILTEYSDVYSFGILMLILLLGRSVWTDGLAEHSYNNTTIGYVKGLRERGEPVEFAGDPNDMSPGQMKMFLDLALRCCEYRKENRPKMILVAKEIKLIEQASLD